MASPSRSWAGNVWTPNLGLSPQTAVGRRFSGGKDVGASTGAALSALLRSLTRSGRVIGNGSDPERAIFLYGGPLANAAAVSSHAAG
jgi:hypothetical protein